LFAKWRPVPPTPKTINLTVRQVISVAGMVRVVRDPPRPVVTVTTDSSRHTTTVES
jgi:hypothetical protein